MNPEMSSDAADRVDRKMARQWMKEQIILQPEISKRIDEILRDAKKEAFKAKYTKQRSASRHRLENTPVTSLLRKDPRVNPRSLTLAGIVTAAHVLDLGASKLAVKTGIDANAAEKWVRAAKEVRRVRSEDARPPDRVSGWTNEDVELARALIILDSAWLLRHNSNALTDPVDEARILLRRTSAPLWKLFPARRDFLMQRIADLMQRTSPAETAQAVAQAESNLSRHLTLVGQLHDPNEVVRIWHYRQDDLLKLLADEVP